MQPFNQNQRENSEKMELELGLKLTKVADEFSSAELLLAKDRAGPLFMYAETDTMFILTAHLKGYKRENVRIDINEDGTRIGITVAREVQQIVMLGWTMVKKERETQGFRKAFKIPNGVVLDKIKARFNYDESILKISMPKLVKGVTGAGIEEVKEEGISRGNSAELQVVSDEDGERETLKKEYGAKGVGEIDQTVENLVKEHRPPAEIHPEEGKMGGNEIEGEEPSQKIQEPDHQDQHNQDQPVHRVEKSGNDTQGVDADDGSSPAREEKSLRDQSTQTDKSPPRKSKICAPIIAGSALIVSIIVFVVHFIRTKNQPGKRKN